MQTRKLNSDNPLTTIHQFIKEKTVNGNKMVIGKPQAHIQILKL